MSTSLYKESIAEAKKLRQIAEDDAKKSIAEEITPYIKKVISEQIGAATHSGFFIEQGDEPEVLPLDPEAGVEAPPPDLAGSEPGGETALDAPVTDPMSPDDLGAGLGDTPEMAPVAPNGEDILSATMPDADGKITVDFEDLFADVGDVGDAGRFTFLFTGRSVLLACLVRADGRLGLLGMCGPPDLIQGGCGFFPRLSRSACLGS